MASVTKREPNQQALTDLKLQDVLDCVTREWFRQHAIWPRHDWPAEYWLTILMEEIGEAAHEMLHENRHTAIIELIQCMAVLASWIEAESVRHGEEVYGEQT